MFARLEVLSFHRFLRRLNALRDQPRLNRHTFFHPQLQHQSLQALAAEDAHQVVFQREEEARAARVALPPGAPAQLVINAPRFVPLRPQDVQPAHRHHFIVLAGGLFFEAGERLRPFFFRHPEELPLVVEIDVLFVAAVAFLARRQRFRLPVGQQVVLGYELRVAAQHDVGAASGHVGREGDGVLPPRLRHDEGFALVLLGVQHLVRQSRFLQQRRQPLRVFN